MQLKKMLRMSITAVAVSVGSLALTAAPSSASTHPVVVYACGMSGNWSCPEVRPAEIGFGSLWAFTGTGNINGPQPLRPIHWTHWTQRSAFGSGQYFASACENCRPAFDYRADIALTVIKYHKSRPYFEEATITAKGHKTVHLWYFYERTGPWQGYWWHP